MLTRFVAFIVAIVAFSVGSSHAAARRPNIVLIMPDDVGYGDYACLGNPVMRTPSVDAFKQQSLLFTNFHVSPTCAPCRSALMSGRHEFKNGVTHTILERERMSLDTITLAQVLKSAGYTTGVFGKWHLGDEAAYRPESRGFDEVFIHGAGGIGQTYPGSCGDAPHNTNINPALWHNGKFEKTHGYCTDLFFDQAETWIDHCRKGDKPFFAYITPNAAHAPHVLPKQYYEHYLDKPGVNQEMAKFFGMIENIDTNFGKLLTKLKDWGLENDTLVIYIASDNGGTAGVPLFNAGMKGKKGTPYQGGIRTASFWRWPGEIGSGVECDALCAHLDVFPTLVDLLGVQTSDAVKKQVEGRSMLPLLKDPKAAWPDRILFTHLGRWDRGQAAAAKHTHCSVQNSRFTLVNNEELYDLKSDPGETTNVIADYPQVVAELRAAYDRWWSDVQPRLVNENATGPAINPFKELYWKQFGGAPDAEMLKLMDPSSLLPGAKEKPKAKAKKRAAS